MFWIIDKVHNTSCILLFAADQSIYTASLYFTLKDRDSLTFQPRTVIEGNPTAPGGYESIITQSNARLSKHYFDC